MPEQRSSYQPDVALWNPEMIPYVIQPTHLFVSKIIGVECGPFVV